MLFLTFGILNWLTSLPYSHAEQGCGDWKLYGGRKDYEGMVEINNKDTKFNLCKNKSPGVYEICRNVRHFPGGENYTDNVFDAILHETAISGMCGRETVCKANDTVNCCKPVGVCCLDISSGDVCSANWSQMYNKTCHHKEVDIHCDYFKTRSIKFRKNALFSKAWTKSFLSFKRKNCSKTATPSKEVLKDCANKCLNKEHWRKITISLDGTCSCTDKESDSYCTAAELEVRNSWKENLHSDLCIAGTVEKGTITFSAEECSLFLQPLCVCPREDNSSDSGSGNSTDSSYFTDEAPSTIYIPVLASCVGAFVLFIIVILICKCLTFSRKGDAFRNNGMYNRTYGRQLNRQQSLNEEEYAIISDIELDSGTSMYKPRLPVRGNNIIDPTYNKIGEKEKDVSISDIITLDEYSSPSDMIKNKVNAFDPASEYTTTYDDPIRHNLHNVAECKRKSEMKNEIENQALDRDIDDNTNSFESYKDDKDERSCSFKCKEGTRKGTDINEKVLIDSDETMNKTVEYLKESKEELVEALSSSLPFKITVKEDERDGATVGYEDTNIIDGNFPDKPKDIFEEHVCLNCLKPEHLERLGIKIITDDNALEKYEKDKLIAAPDRDRTPNHTNVSKKNDNGDVERECVICKNVYDCLGKIKPQILTNSEGDQYDHIRNIKESTL